MARRGWSCEFGWSRVLSPSERELIRVVVEVHKLRAEGQEGDEAKEEAEDGEKEAEEDASPSAVTAARKAPKPSKEPPKNRHGWTHSTSSVCRSVLGFWSASMVYVSFFSLGMTT
jgi:hypothetical protein